MSKHRVGIHTLLELRFIFVCFEGKWYGLLFHGFRSLCSQTFESNWYGKLPRVFFPLFLVSYFVLLDGETFLNKWRSHLDWMSRKAPVVCVVCSCTRGSLSQKINVYAVKRNFAFWIMREVRRAYFPVIQYFQLFRLFQDYNFLYLNSTIATEKKTKNLKLPSSRKCFVICAYWSNMNEKVI